MEYTAVTNELNYDLCAIEKAIYMLKIANVQLREATRRNLSQTVIRYFEDKNEVYAENRQSLLEEINLDFYAVYDAAVKGFDRAKADLWQEFKKVYPNCKLNFEDIFGVNTFNFAPINEEYLQNEQAGKNAEIHKKFNQFSSYAVLKHQMENFRELKNAITEQTNEYGAEPFLTPELSKKICKVSNWAVCEISDEIEKLQKQYKKDAVKLGIQLNKLKKEHKNNLNNPDALSKIEQIESKLSSVEDITKNAYNLEIALTNLLDRFFAGTTKYTRNDSTGLIIEKILEIASGAPHDIKKLTSKKLQTLALKEEIENITELAKLFLSTVEPAMVLSLQAGKELKLELFNYEYSKEVVRELIKKHAEYETRKQEILKKQLKNLASKDDEQELIEIDTCKKACDILRIETPFGILAMYGNTLLNVETKQAVDLKTLDDFVFDGKNFVKTENGKQTTQISFEEVKNKLSAVNKGKNL